MYDIDFLPVEGEDGPSSKSGDAITLRFTVPGWTREAVVIIDGGFQATGESVVEHVNKYYDTNYVDLVISTHPDADHLNGLGTIIEKMEVGELLIHQPRLHVGAAAKDISNIEAIDNLIELAESHEVPIAEPFTGTERIDGLVRILGPSPEFYRNLIEAHLEEMKDGSASTRMAHQGSGLLMKARELLQRAIDHLPIETLSDNVETSLRNNTSAITLIHLDDRPCLFTGDAGIAALTNAADDYENTYDLFKNRPLHFFQAPHHGGRRNLGPTILNRVLGAPGDSHGEFRGGISSAKADVKHPSPKVTNALIRRGGKVVPTEGSSLLWSSGSPNRPGYGPATPLGPLSEDDDD